MMMMIVDYLTSLFYVVNMIMRYWKRPLQAGVGCEGMRYSSDQRLSGVAAG